MGAARFHIAAVALLAAVSGACSVRTFPGPGERLVIANGDVEDRGSLRVPPGHMPNVGQCRIWFPGRPPGRQPKAGSCAGLQRTAPAGSWILYRPTSDRKVVHARVIDPKRDGIVVSVRIYDVDRGTYLREEKSR
jgi:hypothetical protein